MEDREIVKKLFAHDESGIAAMKTKYGKRLLALSFGIVGEKETAEECENDTYLAAWNAIPPADPSDYLYPFLARIVRRISLDVCRARGAEKRRALLTELTREMEECIPSPDFEASDETLGTVLGDFLASLDGEKRNIFVRRYFFLDSVEAVARRYGLTQSKVKVTLFRLRESLKTKLEKEGYRV